MKFSNLLACIVFSAALTYTGQDARAATAPAVDPELAGRFARLALDCVHREYPN